MPAYAYNTHVDYKRQQIRETHSKDFDSPVFTIKQLAPLVGDCPFNVVETKNGGCSLFWTELREENDEEWAERIVKLENYNAEVNRRRALRE